MWNSKNTISLRRRRKLVGPGRAEQPQGRAGTRDTAPGPRLTTPSRLGSGDSEDGPSRRGGRPLGGEGGCSPHLDP